MCYNMKNPGGFIEGLSFERTQLSTLHHSQTQPRLISIAPTGLLQSFHLDRICPPSPSDKAPRATEQRAVGPDKVPSCRPGLPGTARPICIQWAKAPLPGIAGHAKVGNTEALLTGGPEACPRGKCMPGDKVYFNAEEGRPSARPNSIPVLVEADHARSWNASGLHGLLCDNNTNGLEWILNWIFNYPKCPLAPCLCFLHIWGV